MKQTANLQEWKVYDGTTATTVASISSTGSLSFIDGGTASSTY
jgi:hypothetical protein